MTTDFHLVWSDTKSFLFVSFLMIDSHQKKMLYHVNLCKMQAKLLLKVMIPRAIEQVLFIHYKLLPLYCTEVSDFI